jgi:hypothetical protein
MEDLDRDLKLVQLQRERLALKREMAFQGMGGEAKKVSKALGRAAAYPFMVFARYWKGIRYAVLAVGCIGAVLAVVLHFHAEGQRLAEESWWAKVNAYTAEACPETKFACDSNYGCLRAESERKICGWTARLSYEKQVPRPESN